MMTARRPDDHSLLNLTAMQARDIARDPAQAEWALLRLSALARERADAAGAEGGEDAAAQGAAAGGEDAAGGAQFKTAAGKPDLSTPSAMIAPYLKPNTKKKAKKRGRAAGHEGARRAAPLHIDHRVEHELKCCPDCGKKVCKRGKPRKRVIEDLAPTGAEATEHTLHSYYCQHCKKRVEPKVTQALPKSTIGNRALALTAWLHYGLGNTVSQIEQVLSRLFQLPVSGGGLVQQWQRLAGILDPWHRQIAAEAREAAVLNVDESGWRVNGGLHWLWCFAAPTATYFEIHPSRGARVPIEVLGENFKGTLVSDFLPVYDKLKAGRRQVCLVHLLREIKRVSERNDSEEWTRFAKPLKRILEDAFKLGRRSDRDAPDFISKRARIERRLEDLCWGNIGDGDECRIMARILKHEDSIFTFLHDDAVPPDNNRAEREIRPAVIARKNSFHNTSDKGAQTQAVLMSVYRTLKLRGRDPLAEIVGALEHFILRGTLPPLPGPAAAPTQTVAAPAPISPAPISPAPPAQPDG
jgi:transposase